MFLLRIFYANSHSGGEYRMAHENLQVETVEGVAVEGGLAAGEEGAEVGGLFLP